MERTITQQERSGRMTFIMLAVVFLGPLLLAAVLFKYELIPGGKTNKGQLLSEPVALEAKGLTPVKGGDAVDLPEAVRGKWTLAHVSSSNCEESCEDSIYTSRQIRTMTNRDMTRVQRLWLVADGQQSSDVKRVMAQNHGMQVLSAAEQPELLARFPNADTAEEHIYLLDPNGYLVMHWRADTEPRSILKDLKKFLKYSKAG